MKKLVLILLALTLVLCLVGCEEYNETTLGEKNNSDIYIWTDEETGVQYVVYSLVVKGGGGGAGGITPRLNADGTLYTVESEDTE